MNNTTQQQDHSSSTSGEQQKIAVPYNPPPPPDESSQKKFRSPMVNGVLVALVILIGGFMTYNVVGHGLTQLSAQSDVRNISPSPSAIPTDTPVPTISYSPSQ